MTEIIQKDEDVLIIEKQSNTLDAPYSDTFSCFECWILISKRTQPESCLFLKLMRVNFVKYTMFRGKIESQSEAGMIEDAKIWWEIANRGKYLTQAPPPRLAPEPEQIP